MQDEHGSLLHGQPPEDAFELVTVGHGGADIRRRPCLPVDDADLGRVPLATAGLRITGMHEDPMDPRLEAMGLAEPRQLSPRGEEGVLQCVLREPGIPQDAERDGEQPVAHLVHQEREGIRITASCSLHEVVHRDLT